MNWVDTTVLFIVALSAVIACARGFIAEVLGIGAWVGAFFLASTTAHLLRPTMRGWIGNSDIADPAAYGAVFLLGLIVLSVFTGMIGGAVRNSVLSGVDRTLGVAFGIVRGVVILAALYIGATQIVGTDRWSPAAAEARSVPYIHTVAAWIVRFLPPDYRPHVPAPPVGRVTSAAELLQATPHGRPTSRP